MRTFDGKIDVIDQLFQVVGINRPPGSLCHFCFGPDTLVRYVVEDFECTEAKQKSIGQWLACGTCAALIMRGDAEGLIGLATARLYNQLCENVEAKVIAASVRESHSRFWQAWKDQ